MYKEEHVKLMKKLLLWPEELLFPVLDVFKNIVYHQNTFNYFVLQHSINFLEMLKNWQYIVDR